MYELLRRCLYELLRRCVYELLRRCLYELLRRCLYELLRQCLYEALRQCVQYLVFWGIKVTDGEATPPCVVELSQHLKCKVQPSLHVLRPLLLRDGE